MSRIAVLADIHGNLPALEAVAADLAQFQPDAVVVAGDIVSWGPSSLEVLDLVTSHGWAVIRGNHEYYVLDYGTPRARPEWHDPRQFPQLPDLHRQLAGRWLRTIAAWPDTLQLRLADAPPLRIVHGTPASPWAPMYPDAPAEHLAALLGGVEETTVVAAHTHLPMDRVVDRWHLINPGSVGVPLDGIFGAAYAILEGSPAGWQAEIRRIPFDYEALFATFRARQWVERYGVGGRLAVEEFRTARPWIHPFLVWRQRHHPGAPITEELLGEFWTVDPAVYTTSAYLQAALAGAAGDQA
ncbi:MAG TPA: metallophosphoesterase [Chloroflexia bacterium]|nr:metallophosphoesterase [Chloroflexia bacterium]